MRCVEIVVDRCRGVMGEILGVKIGSGLGSCFIEVLSKCWNIQYTGVSTVVIFAMLRVAIVFAESLLFFRDILT